MWTSLEVKFLINFAIIGAVLLDIWMHSLSNVTKSWEGRGGFSSVSIKQNRFLLTTALSTQSVVMVPKLNTYLPQATCNVLWELNVAAKRQPGTVFPSFASQVPTNEIEISPLPWTKILSIRNNSHSFGLQQLANNSSFRTKCNPRRDWLEGKAWFMVNMRCLKCQLHLSTF